MDMINYLYGIVLLLLLGGSGMLAFRYFRDKISDSRKIKTIKKDFYSYYNFYQKFYENEDHIVVNNALGIFNRKQMLDFYKSEFEDLMDNVASSGIKIDHYLDSWTLRLRDNGAFKDAYDCYVQYGGMMKDEYRENRLNKILN